MPPTGRQDVINYETFSRLAPAQKAKLLALLPAGDQTPEGLRHLLTNSDAFVQALAEYQVRVVAAAGFAPWAVFIGRCLGRGRGVGNTDD